VLFTWSELQATNLSEVMFSHGLSQSESRHFVVAATYRNMEPIFTTEYAPILSSGTVPGAQYTLDVCHCLFSNGFSTDQKKVENQAIVHVIGVDSIMYEEGSDIYFFCKPRNVCNTEEA